MIDKSKNLKGYLDAYMKQSEEKNVMALAKRLNINYNTFMGIYRKNDIKLGQLIQISEELNFPLCNYFCGGNDNIEKYKSRIEVLEEENERNKKIINFMLEQQKKNDSKKN